MQKAAPQSPTTSANIFQVALEAGVSITTVSHVFSSKRHVSEETRKRVLAVAERLGYRPRASARALATGRSMTIALQHSLSGPEFAVNPFFGAMLPSMSEAAISAGYSFIFVPADPPEEVFVNALIAERRVDGAILIDPVPGDAFVDAVIALDMPAVSLGRVEGHPEKLSVDHDHARALEAAFEHLAIQGYERPAMLSLAAEMSYVADLDAAFERSRRRGHRFCRRPSSPSAAVTSSRSSCSRRPIVTTRSSASTTSSPWVRHALRWTKACSFPTSSGSSAWATASVRARPRYRSPLCACSRSGPARCCLS